MTDNSSKSTNNSLKSIDNLSLEKGSVLNEYAPKLRRFLTFRLGNENDAQDLAQEAYFRLCRVKSPELIRQPEAYLFKIADNLANEFLLKKHKEPNMINLDTLHEIGGASDGSTFSNHIENGSKINFLESVIADMPTLYQATLLLRKRDGLSHKEIAEKLGISIHTVNIYLKRAVAHCRAVIKE